MLTLGFSLGGRAYALIPGFSPYAVDVSLLKIHPFTDSILPITDFKIGVRLLSATLMP